MCAYNAKPYTLHVWRPDPAGDFPHTAVRLTRQTREQAITAARKFLPIIQQVEERG